MLASFAMAHIWCVMRGELLSHSTQPLDSDSGTKQALEVLKVDVLLSPLPKSPRPRVPNDDEVRAMIAAMFLRKMLTKGGNTIEAGYWFDQALTRYVMH